MYIQPVGTSMISPEFQRPSSSPVHTMDLEIAWSFYNPQLLSLILLFPPSRALDLPSHLKLSSAGPPFCSSVGFLLVSLNSPSILEVLTSPSYKWLEKFHLWVHCHQTSNSLDSEHHCWKSVYTWRLVLGQACLGILVFISHWLFCTPATPFKRPMYSFSSNFSTGGS